MKNKIINLALVLTIAAILAVFACYIRVRVTPDSVVVLRTSGKTSGICADKITEILELQKGVASTEVDMAASKVIVWYNSHSVKPDALVRNLTGSGYGCTVLISVLADRYAKMTGKTGGVQAAMKSSSGSCCNSK